MYIHICIYSYCENLSFIVSVKVRSSKFERESSCIKVISKESEREREQTIQYRLIINFIDIGQRYILAEKKDQRIKKRYILK